MPKRELFGEVAVRLGFAKPKDIKDALAHQQKLKEAGKKHLLIGLIMLQMNILDTTQLITTLKEMEKQTAKHLK